jgi:small subunit ribosomal protein S13
VSTAKWSSAPAWSGSFAKTLGTNNGKANRFMARILGIDIPSEKRIDIALRYVYGIGPKLSSEILEKTEIEGSVRAKELTEEQLAKIVHVIQEDGYLVEGDLRRDITMNLKRLKSIRAYRGIRHERGLPVRGQRTSTNARTRKGPKKTVGAKRNPNAKTGIH